MASSQQHAATVDLNLSEDWGSEPLSAFLTQGWRHTADTFANERGRFDALADVDRAFRTLVENLGGSADPLAAVQVVRAHGSLLAAASLATSGQLAEAYELMRSVLAAGLQGLFIAGDAERQKTWLARNDDPSSRGRRDDEFTPARMHRHLEKIDATTAAIFDKLDGRAAEQSDHPNANMGHFGAAANGKRGAEPLGVEQTYFAVGHETQRFCLRSLAQVGICTLSLFFYAFPELYRSAGLDAQLTKLRQGH